MKYKFLSEERRVLTTFNGMNTILNTIEDINIEDLEKLIPKNDKIIQNILKGIKIQNDQERLCFFYGIILNMYKDLEKKN